MEFEEGCVTSPECKRKKNKEVERDWESLEFSKLLGTGSYGEVYLGHLDGEKVAVKRLWKGNARYNKEYQQREVLAGKTLHHEGVVRLLHQFETPEYEFQVYHYFFGMDLIEYMKTRDFRPLEEDFAKMILKQIFVAVLHCHGHGIAHRDLKLENILINPYWRIALIDFGLCTVWDTPGPHTTEWVGSLDYIAPEIVQKTPYDSFRADVFSLGIVAYCLLHGKFPFLAAERKANIAELGKDAPVCFSRQNLSKEAVDLLERMLEGDPSNRITLEDVLRHPWLLEADQEYSK